MSIDAGAAAVLVALIAAIGSSVAAFVGLRNTSKLDVIHVLVNSNLSAIKSDLASANAELNRLRDRLMDSTADKAP